MSRCCRVLAPPDTYCNHCGRSTAECPERKPRGNWKRAVEQLAAERQQRAQQPLVPAGWTLTERRPDMDIDAAVARANELAGQIDKSTDDFVTAALASELVDVWNGIYQHLTRGGYLPAVWETAADGTWHRKLERAGLYGMSAAIRKAQQRHPETS